MCTHIVSRMAKLKLFCLTPFQEQNAQEGETYSLSLSQLDLPLGRIG